MKKIFLSLISLSFIAVAYAQDGWTSLFDGKSLAGWKQLAGKAEFKVEDGVIVGTTVARSPNTFLVTEKSYDNFIIELDVKIEDSNSNSGVQFRSHFDPTGNNGKGKVFGYQYELDPSSRMWTAGVYDEGRRDWLYPLSLNASAQKKLATGVFHRIRIQADGHHIRTWINGVPAAHVIDSLDAEGFIALQVHSISNASMAGKKIYWKNIRITTNADYVTGFPETIFPVNLIPNHLTPQERVNGWRLLFNGRNTDGWKGAYKDQFPAKGWEIIDGELRVLAAGGGESVNGGDIVTEEQYKSFDLAFEFKLSPGANSGVKYFVTLSENNSGSAIGLEYQLLDDTLHPDAKMGRDGNRTLASLYDLIKAEKQSRFIRQPGNWNSGRILVYPDGRVEHYLNGIKVLAYKRGSKEFRDLVAISKYKDWPNFGEAPQGHILLQDHGNQVSFRSVRIREIK